MNVQINTKFGLQEEISSMFNQSAMIKDLQIANLETINDINKSTLLNINKELNQYKKRQQLLVIGGCTLSASLALLLLFK